MRKKTHRNFPVSFFCFNTFAFQTELMRVNKKPLNFIASNLLIPKIDSL